MNTRSQAVPGTGFVVLAIFGMMLALLLSWTFAGTRIEATILLEEQGMQQLYRKRYDEALDYFYRSSLVDTDRFHHVLRYLDSLRLALQTGNAEMADYFFNAVADESPDLLGTEEFYGLLQLQANPTNAIGRIVHITGIESIDKKALNQALAEYADSLDEASRSAFQVQLNQALKASFEGRAAQ